MYQKHREGCKAVIQVELGKKTFYIKYPQGDLTEATQDKAGSCFVGWGGDAEAAWARAKTLAGWYRSEAAAAAALLRCCCCCCMV